MLDPKDPVSEIEELLEELESFAEKSPWWFPNRIVIPDETFFRITARIRELLPAELTEAKKMLEKRDLILKNAQEEHRRIIDTAERRLEDMTSEDQAVLIAREQAQRLLETSQLEAAALKRDALVYTADLMEDMEKQFTETISVLRRGREFLAKEIGDEMESNLSEIDDSGNEPESAQIGGSTDETPEHG